MTLEAAPEPVSAPAAVPHPRRSSPLPIGLKQPAGHAHALQGRRADADVADAGKAYHANAPSQPMVMGTKALGEFQLREYQRFKRVADVAGIHPE